MSVERQFNWQGQQRVDVPHLRTIDSSNANDFDILAGVALAGTQALVVTGFVLITTGAVGQPATALQLQVDPGVVWHYNASENGTIFRTAVGTAPEILSSTNPNVQGSFTAGQLNYVGLDLLRSTDATTADLVEFLDADTLVEEPETVPLARTLNYSIIISTTDFTSQPNVLPLALVTTDASNNVLTIVDARQMAFRLGAGGTTPNVNNTYTWPQGRNELANSDGFSGGDKAFTSLHDAIQGIESRLREVGGGPFWYSTNADRQVKLTRNLNLRFANGDNFTVYPSATISSASNNQTLPQSTINVGTLTTGFPTSGTIYVVTSSGIQAVQYAGLGTESFTGCTGGVGTMFTGNSVTLGGTGSNLLWQGLAFAFCNSGNSTIFENAIADQTSPLAGLTDLVPGECLYVDLNELAQLTPTGTPLQMQKSSMASLGVAAAPYTRWVVAWCIADSNGNTQYFTLDSQFGVGTILSPASTTANGVVELNTTPFSSTNPVVVVADSSDNAIAPGITRGNGTTLPYFAAGTLALGAGSNDTTITLGNSTNTTQVLHVGYGPNTGGHTTNLDGNLINIGVGSVNPTIKLGSGSGDTVTLQPVTLNLNGTTTANVNLYSNTSGGPSGQIGSTSQNFFIGNNNASPWQGVMIVGDADAQGQTPVPAGSAFFTSLQGGFYVSASPIYLSSGSFAASSMTSWNVQVENGATGAANIVIQGQGIGTGVGTMYIGNQVGSGGNATEIYSSVNGAYSTHTPSSYESILNLVSQATGNNGSLTAYANLTAQTGTGSATTTPGPAAVSISAMSLVTSGHNSGPATVNISAQTVGTGAANINLMVYGGNINIGTEAYASTINVGSNSTYGFLVQASVVQIGNNAGIDTITIGRNGSGSYTIMSGTEVEVQGTQSLALNSPYVELGGNGGNGSMHLIDTSSTLSSVANGSLSAGHVSTPLDNTGSGAVNANGSISSLNCTDHRGRVTVSWSSNWTLGAFAYQILCSVRFKSNYSGTPAVVFSFDSPPNNPGLIYTVIPNTTGFDLYVGNMTSGSQTIGTATMTYNYIVVG